MVNGEPLKFAASPQPVRDTASVCDVPVQLFALVSVTVISPFESPKSTVIWLLSGPALPAVIDAPAGTVHT